MNQSEQSSSDLEGVVALFDKKVDHLFDYLRANQLANRVFYSASAIGDHSLIWFIISSYLALSSKRRPYAKRAVLALLSESAMINLGVKTLFRRNRPSYEGERPLPLRQPLTSSFPSGHASAGACAVTLLIDASPAGFLLVPLALVVAASRIHVRIHHASDVVGGLVIGVGYAKLVKALFPLKR